MTGAFAMTSLACGIGVEEDLSDEHAPMEHAVIRRPMDLKALFMRLTP
jgi:hypothetical protein